MGVEAEADDLRLDRQLCFPLYAATNALVRAYRTLLDPLGLTYPQYLVMLVLWQTDGITVGDIGRHLHLDSGTLTPLIKRLERAELVARRRDAVDERRVIIDLTQSGRKLKQAAEGVPKAMVAKLGLGLDEIVSLRAQLEKLIDRLGE